jgi:hypothetical protein
LAGRFLAGRFGEVVVGHREVVEILVIVAESIPKEADLIRRPQARG